MRQTRSIMGMPVQLEIVSETATQRDYDDIFNYFTQIDERFSTYKGTSEVSKINRHGLTENQFSDEMKEVLKLSKETMEETDGYFNITKPDGTLDPSGLVKGWAINNAAHLLEKKEFTDFYVEIAGDIQTKGKNAQGTYWSIGVRNPFVPSEVVKVIYPKDRGVATSGTYIRGNHIYDPHDSRYTSPEFVSLTVLGPNVYEADRFATAAFIMGKKGMQFLEAHPDFDAYAIDEKGGAVMTSNFESYTFI